MCVQVQEFEQINGYYSVPELIRKPVDPVKSDASPAAAAAAADKNAGGKDAPAAVAVASADKEAAKEGPAEAAKDGEKSPEKEVS